MCYLIACEDQRKTIKVMSVLRLKWVLITGIAKRIAMAHNNICLLVRHRYDHRSR